ncbi:amino acid/polyamine/organocation transporter, APC superfamily [Actinokineospora alba]|uniref:Amino acid/polyamine/organocation transporter, APC superfamily n=1 Tax=Actinokineospora alba TaxID=504798 RepID=A0A1H0UB68_9PSEU|nr:amino acid permease [Actinokineospora alba]TDP65220.1 amino acid/polyamine/organocation transporter (APC superfamily) [Actinokineospora alba]SDH57048.1 basic amino acid/polyamine antiporter, APA family [Actinokineospora alba]SDP63371.1 amino acid/polyamine/organocation transporter, APC superfamily [Actinokineospora alba]
MPGTGLWRTKSVEQSIADTDDPDTRLRRTLSTWDLTVFGVAVVIGAGIFTLTARTAGDLAGPSTSLAFVFAAIACALAALCYAEFASTVPVAGSAYTFSYATFGEFMAWIIGWDLVLELAVGSAAVAKGWSVYLNTVLGYVVGFDSSATTATVVKIAGFAVDWGALLLVVTLAMLLGIGTKLSSRVSMVITGIKVAIVLFVIVLGLFFVKAANYTPFIPEARPPTDGSGGGVEQSLFSLIAGHEGSAFGGFGLLAAASLVFFAFIGFDIVATTAEETVNPQRSVPRGILGSLAIVTVLYVAVSLVLVGMVSYQQLATTVKPDGTEDKKTLATAFALNDVDWAAQVISVGALAGLTTVVMVLMLGQIRVIYAMSRDGLMPRGLAHTGSRGTPARATIAVAALVAIAATFFEADKLEEMVNVGTLFAFILVSAGVIVLRRTRPDLPRAFRVPWVPLVPLLAIGACLWLMLNLTVLTWLRFGIWMALGVVVYFVYSRRNSVLGKRELVDK